MTTVVEEFRLQSRYCGELGSDFIRQLLSRAADDIEAGGIVARLTADWPGSPKADVVSLRLTGALHAAAITGRDAALTAEYPSARTDWSMDRLWPVTEAFLDRDEAWVRAFMTSPPQTNETGRSGALACGFMWLAERSSQPFHLLELGASAGLNLNWDRFAYAHPAWGRAQIAGPQIPTVINGDPPAWRDLVIASRAACDQNPLDAGNADHRLRLRAYVWPDQPARLARLAAALELAQALGVKVEKADAAQWLRARLAPELPEGTTVVFHSVFLQYPPREVREQIAAAMEEAGSRTTQARRLAWLMFEPEALVAGVPGSTRYVLQAAVWAGGRRSDVTLAEVDPHGWHMTWLG
jgi:hypothetical protein